jgi:hypothetical protein
MNSTLIETVMVLIVLAYIFMAGIFFVNQQQGQSFIASFDKALAWGSMVFLIGCGLDTAAYVAWA